MTAGLGRARAAAKAEWRPAHRSTLLRLQNPALEGGTVLTTAQRVPVTDDFTRGCTMRPSTSK